MKNYYVHRHVPWEKQNKNSNIENNQGILKMYKYMLEWTPKPQLNKIMKMSQEIKIELDRNSEKKKINEDLKFRNSNKKSENSITNRLAHVKEEIWGLKDKAEELDQWKKINSPPQKKIPRREHSGTWILYKGQTYKKLVQEKKRSG